MTPTNTPSTSPHKVAADDKITRRRAARAAGRAYVGHPLWWVVFCLLLGIGTWSAFDTWETYMADLPSWMTALSLTMTLLLLTAAVILLPASIAFVIYRADTLYYVDTGSARAAMATRPDNRKGALKGDIQAHTLGAHPKKEKAGGVLARWVRDQVHADGGRITATALPGLAKTYKKHGMVDDGRTAGFLTRVASKPRR